MQPVFCRVKHDREAGTFGDCLRACVASIFERDYSEVPHFFEDGCEADEGYERLRKWCEAETDCLPFYTGIGAGDVNEVLDFMNNLNPGIFYILGGSNGGDHSVIGFNDKIVHNPEWIPTAIHSPTSMGYYTITVFVRA